MRNQTKRPVLSLKKRLAFILVLGVMGLCLAEVGARAVDALSGISLDEHRARYWNRRCCRLESWWPAQRGDYPYLPFIPNSNDPRVNELGFRGAEITMEKPANTYRIFCLGGSTTWDEYPAMLQEELRDDFADRGLNLEVINAGNVFWTTMESQINFLTRCMPLKPDAIIVYHGINDAIPAFGRTHSLDYSHWRGRLEKNHPLIWDKLPIWLDRSAAYVAVRAVFEKEIPTLGWNEMTMNYQVNFERDEYHGMEPYRQNMYTLLSLARARGVEAFICTPTFNYDYEFKQSLVRWGLAVDEANEITRDLANRWDDVYLVDVAANLIGGNDWMIDMCHFTPDGKRRIARFIADAVRPHLDHLVEKRGDPLDLTALLSHLPNGAERNLAAGPESLNRHAH